MPTTSAAGALSPRLDASRTPSAGSRRVAIPTIMGLFVFGIGTNRQKRLEGKYKRLLGEAHRLSHFDRKKSDLKLAEAEQVRKQLDATAGKARNEEGK